MPTASPTETATPLSVAITNLVKADLASGTGPAAASA